MARTKGKSNGGQRSSERYQTKANQKDDFVKKQTDEQVKQKEESGLLTLAEVTFAESAGISKTDFVELRDAGFIVEDDTTMVIRGGGGSLAKSARWGQADGVRFLYREGCIAARGGDESTARGYAVPAEYPLLQPSVGFSLPNDFKKESSKAEVGKEQKKESLESIEAQSAAEREAQLQRDLKRRFAEKYNEVKQKIDASVQAEVNQEVNVEDAVVQSEVNQGMGGKEAKEDIVQSEVNQKVRVKTQSRAAKEDIVDDIAGLDINAQNTTSTTSDMGVQDEMYGELISKKLVSAQRNAAYAKQLKREGQLDAAYACKCEVRDVRSQTLRACIATNVYARPYLSGQVIGTLKGIAQYASMRRVAFAHVGHEQAVDFLNSKTETFNVDAYERKIDKAQRAAEKSAASGNPVMEARVESEDIRTAISNKISGATGRVMIAFSAALSAFKSSFAQTQSSVQTQMASEDVMRKEIEEMLEEAEKISVQANEARATSAEFEV